MVTKIPETGTDTDSNRISITNFNLTTGLISAVKFPIGQIEQSTCRGAFVRKMF